MYTIIIDVIVNMRMLFELVIIIIMCMIRCIIMFGIINICINSSCYALLLLFI